jgi:two-component system sensor histidine kinase ChvG
MKLPRLTSSRLSRIGLRLFAFNLLVVFIPVAGVLYLDVYETRLRQAQEASLVQQARVLAASLGDRAALDGGDVTRLFARLERRSDARLRVYDTAGDLIADSARQSAGTSLDDLASYPGTDEGQVRRRRLYQLGAWLVQQMRRAKAAAAEWVTRTPRSVETDASAPPPEVRAALAGRYGAATRTTPGQRSVTMFSAVPVRHEGTITGAVVVSQSTFRILSALYAVRLRVFEIILGSLLAAALLTALAATTIVRPLTRLRRQAATLAQRRGPLPATFAGAHRRDEIGDLARALGELARRTNDHVGLVQSFSADVSHELKNPLASIRAAAETMAESDAPAERQRFLALMIRDVARLERLVSGLRDVARVEGQIEADVTEPVVLRTVLEDAVSAARPATPADVVVELASRERAAVVMASPERLRQVFDNLLANATSFAPGGSSIRVTLQQTDGWAEVRVEDEGPGIPEAHLGRIFDRFFTYRPADDRREHVGLGLAIAKQIVESYGGRITVTNRASTGACFSVRLPPADGGWAASSDV